MNVFIKSFFWFRTRVRALSPISRILHLIIISQVSRSGEGLYRSPFYIVVHVQNQRFNCSVKKHKDFLRGGESGNDSVGTKPAFIQITVSQKNIAIWRNMIPTGNLLDVMSTRLLLWENKQRQSTNDKSATGHVRSVAYCAAGAGCLSPQFCSELCASLVGELHSWGGADGQPEAGLQMLPLQVVLQLSFHLQLSRSIWTAADWRTAVNIRWGCSLWVCTAGSDMPFSYLAIKSVVELLRSII